MDAGKPHGLTPFGLEPQRLLRLQKMHVLVGQDTDSESTPFAAAMPWIVKLDKEEDFIGKWALEHYAERRARDRARRLHDGQRARPDRGRGRRAQRRGRRAGDDVALLAAGRQGHRPGVGAEGPRRRRRRDHDLRRRHDATTPSCRRSRSTTPRGRCCAREPGVPCARRRGRERPPHAARTDADGARRPRRRGPLRGPRRLERRGRLRVARARARGVPRDRRMGRRRPTSASSSCTPRAPATSRRSSPRRPTARRSSSSTATRAADAWWLPLTAGRALVVCEPAALPGLRERLEEAAAPRRARSASSTRRASTRR